MTDAAKDFRELFLQQWQRLETLAKRRFVDANVADEAMLFTQEAMAKNNWGPLRAYEGRATASFATFFTQIAWRMLEDFSRVRFGRLHIPQWIADQGPFLEEVYRLLCLERMPVSHVLEFLSHSAPGGRSETTIWAAINTILKRATDCGKSSVSEISTEDELLDDLAGPGTTLHRLSPEELKMVQQREEILLAVHRFLTSDAAIPASEGQSGRIVLEKLNAMLKLDSEERLLLKLLYQDCLEVDAAARLLGLNGNQVYGRQRRLLARIRKALEQAGLAEMVHGLLTPEHDF
ncbi:MAG: sigma-70 family RNA polymerase sigma factor [Magnetococcales bacterium]|nr:sigma-70 family RNA polymerase sigma factor [Magnetococcales bacterium]